MEAHKYQLRSKRQPRYKCGTCGLRDCVCLLTVNENWGASIGARRVPPEGRKAERLVYRHTVRAEKTYSAVERTGDHPVDTILQKLSSPGVAKAPCPRFKEWTSDGKELEFSLATVMPPVCLGRSILSASLYKWPVALLPICPSGSVTLALLLRKSTDSHDRGSHIVLSYHRLVSGSGEFYFVVGVDHHLVHHLSSNPLVG